MEKDKDLVVRLRWFSTNLQSDSPIVPPLQQVMAEAADEIERLRASRDEWCAAYTELRDDPKSPAN